MKSELLSICILTYNRSALLRETLEAFIAQARDYNIPIYVSDNCSSDNTASVVQECQAKYEYLFYNKNTQNLGFDGNVMKVVELASSKYCWLFGDDDKIVEGAINEIMPKLEKDYGLIVVNAATCDRDLKQIVEEAHCTIEADREYTTKELQQLFSDLVVYTSFVGSLIVEKKLWNKIEHQKYLQKGFVHVGIAFEYIAQSAKSAFFISKPLIHIRLNNAGWASSSFRIWQLFWPQTIAAIPGYSEERKRKVAALDFNISLATMLIERAKGALDLSVAKEYIRSVETMNGWKKGLMVLATYLPRTPLRMLYKFYLRYKKPPSYKYILAEMEMQERKKVEYI